MSSKRLQNLLLDRGLSLSRTTPTDAVAGLISRLRPIGIGRALTRVGAAHDGGYLLPDDFDGVTACFSPGVNDEVGFELSMAQRGIRSFLADFSVPGPPVEHPLFDFEPLFIDAFDGEGRTTMARWVEEKAAEDTGDFILQMDIEGSEYAALTAMPPELLARFRIIAIEFHHLNKLFDPVVFMFYRSCFEKLLALFDVVHLHPNNALPVYTVGELVVPQAMEMTFYRKGRCPGNAPLPRFPHPLDADCDSNKPTLVLPRCWQAT